MSEFQHQYRSLMATDMCYTLRYLECMPEMIKGLRIERWKLRKVGVYAKYFPRQKRAVWIHTFASDRFKRRLDDVLERATVRGPMDIHLLQLGSAMERWDDYTDELEVRLQHIVSGPQGISITY